VLLWASVYDQERIMCSKICAPCLGWIVQNQCGIDDKDKERTVTVAKSMCLLQHVANGDILRLISNCIVPSTSTLIG